MTSRAGYWIGGGLVALGIVGAIAWSLVTYWHGTSVVNGFPRVAIPGEGIVRLEAREYVVYVEGPGVDRHSPRVRIRMADPRTGKALRLSNYPGVTMDSFGRTGLARKIVSPPRAGAYVVLTSGTARARGYAVAFGDNVQHMTDTTVGGAFAIGALFGLSGITLLMVTRIRRWRRRGTR